MAIMLLLSETLLKVRSDVEFLLLRGRTAGKPARPR